MLEYLAFPASRASSISSRETPNVSAAWYRYCPWPASSWTLASSTNLRRRLGAIVIQPPSGSIPTTSLCACCEIIRISCRRYSSGIQSPGSIFSPAATRASKAARRKASSVIRLCPREDAPPAIRASRPPPSGGGSRRSPEDASPGRPAPPPRSPGWGCGSPARPPPSPHPPAGPLGRRNGLVQRQDPPPPPLPDDQRQKLRRPGQGHAAVARADVTDIDVVGRHRQVAAQVEFFSSPHHN